MVIKTWLAGLNWTKVILYVVLVAALFGGGWLMGANHEKVECADERAKDIAALMDDHQKQLDEYQKEIRRRIDIAQEATRESAELRSALTSIGEGISEEIEKRAPAASCAPSDREWRLYQEAASKTRN